MLGMIFRAPQLSMQRSPDPLHGGGVKLNINLTQVTHKIWKATGRERAFCDELA